MKCKFLLLLLTTAIFTSCSSEDDNSTPTEESFYALRVGNSWVYKVYNNDLNDTGIIDSVSIVGTKNFNGETYYEFQIKSSGHDGSFSSVFYDEGKTTEFLRDSSGYLIHENGKIKFTNSDYSERLVEQRESSAIYEKLSPILGSVTVNAGVFTTTFSEQYARGNDGEQYEGRNEIHYVENIGRVYEFCSYVSGGVFAYRKLESYDFQ